MKQSLFALCASVVMAIVMGAGADEAQAYGPRQYYSSWQKHSTHSYAYRNYYYKPTPKYSGYKHHYVVYYPSRPQYYYYYNPYSKQYWGRCPTETNGEPLYSMLDPKDRKSSLKDIPESAFPKPTNVPPIPEAKDNEPLDLPPDDLPPNTPATASGKPAPQVPDKDDRP